MATKKRGLGRGLSSLISPTPVPVAAAQAEPAIAGDASGNVLRYLSLDALQPGQYQPRRDMGAEALEELAASIRSQGIIEPIVVRPLTSNRFEIIAGERRWRAAALAELTEVPVMVRAATDEEAIALALIENIQREDLNPIEEAVALQRLQQEFALTQQQVADMVGKKRATVTNLMRLLKLAPGARQRLETGDLEMGHARALLAVPEPLQEQLAQEVVEHQWSVRQTEQRVRQCLAEPAANKAPTARPDPNIRLLEETLGQQIGAPVSIQHKASGKGSLVIRYGSLDELDGILKHIR